MGNVELSRIGNENISFNSTQKKPLKPGKKKKTEK